MSENEIVEPMSESAEGKTPRLKILSQRGRMTAIIVAVVVVLAGVFLILVKPPQHQGSLLFRELSELGGRAREEASKGAEESVQQTEEDQMGALERACKGLAQQYGLTEREVDMVRYLARGRSHAYISEDLFISENTVKSYIKNVYTKTDVHSKQELLDLLGSM